MEKFAVYQKRHRVKKNFWFDDFPFMILGSGESTLKQHNPWLQYGFFFWDQNLI